MDKDNAGESRGNKIHRAGFIPYFVGDDAVYMLFMQPSDEKYGGPEFQIAKGKVEDGETTQQAAVREAKEELGLFSGNVSSVHSLGKFLGRTTIYIGEIEDRDLFGDPHFETGDTRWMTADEFQQEGRGLHKPVVKAAVRKIAEVLDGN